MKKIIIFLILVNFLFASNTIPIIKNEARAKAAREFLKNSNSVRHIQEIKMDIVTSKHSLISDSEYFSKDKKSKNKQIKVKKSINKRSMQRGKDVYYKSCRLCHGDSRGFVIIYTKKRWNKLLKNRGKKLSSIHSRSRVSRLTDKYFNSARYTRNFEFFKEFILNSSKK